MKRFAVLLRQPTYVIAVICIIVVAVLLLTGCPGQGDLCDRHPNERQVAIGGNCAHDAPGGGTTFHGPPCQLGC